MFSSWQATSDLDDNILSTVDLILVKLTQKIPWTHKEKKDKNILKNLIQNVNYVYLVKVTNKNKK